MMSTRIFDAGGEKRAPPGGRGGGRGAGGRGGGRGRGRGAGRGGGDVQDALAGNHIVLFDNQGEDDPLFDTSKPQPQLKKRKERQKRPKLTPHDLATKLVSIYKTFPSLKFQGKGHEASDLKKLLRRYEEWAQSVDPHVPFEEFVKKMEKFGSAAPVQYKLQIIRDTACGYLGEEALLRDGAGPVEMDDGPLEVDYDIDATGEERYRHKASSGSASKSAAKLNTVVPSEDRQRFFTEYEDEEEEGEWFPLPNIEPQIGASSKRNMSVNNDDERPIVLTDEQKKRIEANRQAAIERFKRRQQAAAGLSTAENENPSTEIGGDAMTNAAASGNTVDLGPVPFESE